MNNVCLMGRLTRDPEVRYSQGGNQTCVARYTLAVTRPFKDSDGNYGADFISCVAFGKAGEFAERWLKKGTMVAVTGRIQTGSYDDKDGKKVYTTDVIVASQEFAGGKSDNANADSNTKPKATARGKNTSSDGFMNVPDGVDDELPFN